MSAFLIQVSGHLISEKAHSRYQAGAEGPRFCDEPLTHGEYFNASPFWKREGYGRYAAWRSASPGDRVLLYCTSSVDEHGACLSHHLTVDEVTRDDRDGARLLFSEKRKLGPTIPYRRIQEEIEAGRLSEQMSYCGQEGFIITEIPETDIERVLEISEQNSAGTLSSDAGPSESLQSIADDYFD